jgi:hypothetical protein
VVLLPHGKAIRQPAQEPVTDRLDGTSRAASLLRSLVTSARPSRPCTDVIAAGNGRPFTAVPPGTQSSMGPVA